MAAVGEILFEPMMVFMVFGGIVPATLLLIAILFSIKREGVWLASILGAAYAALAALAIFQIPAIINTPSPGQHLAVEALFGGLTTLIVMTLIAVGVKLRLRHKASKELETHS